MRSKRLFAMLLVFCLVFANLAPAASALEAPVDGYVNAEQKTNEAASANESTSSPFENGNVISAEGATDAEGMLNLRDNPIVKSEIVENTNVAEGSWDFAPVGSPATSLLPSEVPECIQELREAAELFAADEVVRAFVVMEEAPLADSHTSRALVSASMEKQMIEKQDSVIAAIERTVLGGEKLAVRYQFTYLTNSFSIETEFVNLEKIAMLNGVKSVFVMPVYNAIPTDEETASPNTASATVMTGVAQVWQDTGFTGKGMKIAIIDTGLDLDHPSFAAEPETTDSSLTIADIDAVLENLNAYAKRSTITGKTLYRSAKVPYAFNYVDNSLTADHSADMQGDHGTHVAGIAAANATEGTSVVGMAPDAQIIVMKVFGAAGGAYTDDIVAALEDAMTLGCDVVNASLGSPAGFSSTDTEIDLIYQRLASQDIVACISAGNEGTSSYMNMWGTDLNRTQNPDNATVGQPGIFENAMTVASAENAAVMTSYFSLADGTQVFYMDPYQYYYGMLDLVDPEYWGYTDPIEYVIIDGVGEEADFYDEEGNSLVEGKIAVIKRGDLSFGTKIFNAEYAGAVAAIIWDNVSEYIFNFGMQISDDGETYPTIPACLISLEDGEILAAAETKTLLVSSEPGEREDVNGGQMSSFSSWGVSPELGLEPDITGIGGNVYSCYDGGNYGLMSGTSMSSPQVAGVTALVMQRLYELYPNVPDGTIRELAEALLMSTADPIIDNTFGAYEASPRQQGAGLVDAYEAVTSEVYLTVGGEKPKAELGDSSTGKFTFSFEIHNIGDEAKSYTLDASLLTEYAAGAQLSATEVEYFMYGADMPLSGSVTFDKDTVTVPADGKTDVLVTIELSDEDKAYFAQCWENGGYVEGFVYLTSADDEGVVTSELNLPFLGFYGDWTEAPVFDSAYWYDNGFWGAAPANGLPEGDEYYHVMWTDLAGTDWVLGFNPYSGVYADASGNIVYDESHNVVSPNGDGVLDGLTEIYLSLLRNAKTLTFTYSVDGEVMHRETITHNSKTMYRSSYGQVVPWLYSWYGTGMYDFTDAEGNTLPTGTEVILTIDATVDYGTGGNHSIEIPIYVDNTAGELLAVQSAQLEDGTDVLAVMASDETALASVVVMNPAGTQIYAQAYDVTMQDAGNGAYIAYFDVSELGTEFLVAVCDYAANESYFLVTYEANDGNLPEMDDTQLYAYRVFDDAIYSDHMYGWVSMNKPASAEETANISVWTDDYLEYAAINAAEYVDGKIFAVDAVYNLVVMDPGLFNRTTICNLGVNVLDMSFDDSTDTMYVLSKQDSDVYLYSMDLLTGELTQLMDYGYYYYAPYAIADDDNGTIYAIKYNSSNIFTLDAEYNLVAVTTTVDDVESDVVILDSNGIAAQPNYAQSITWLDGKLYWAYFKNYYNYYLYADLITIDTTDWTSYASPYSAQAYDENGELVTYSPYTELVGLLTLTDTEYEIPAATELTDVLLSDEALILTIGEVANVTASPLPWNYELGEITWTSSDESVATVAGGRITGVGEGTATITVAADGIEKTVAVTVVDTATTFSAYNYYSGDGYYGYMITVDTGIMDYYLDAESPVDWLAGDYNGHDGYFYGYTEGGQFWRYNQETGEAVKLGEPIGSVPVDMAYDYSTGLMYAATTDYNMGYSAINIVNLNTGALQPVYMAEYQFMITLACDDLGNLYTVTAFGELYKYTMENGQPTNMDLILDGLGEINYMQSMCWDHENDVLLWAYCEYGSIVWIDPNAEEPYAVMLGDPTASGLFEFVGMHTVPAEIPELDYVAVEDVYAEDMLMLVGVTKNPNVTVYPFNATEQTVAWTSSDEAVVKINADGTLTAVSEGTAAVSGTLTDGENTFEASFNVTVLEGADDVYGMVMTDLATMAGQYWVRIYTQDPSDPDMLSATAYVIYAEEQYNGKLYAVGYDPNDWSGNWQYFVMDPVTHAVESQTALGDAYPFVYDMTYDYTTSTMYATAGPSSDDADLYVFNMENGELIPLMQPEQFFMSLAAGPDGKLYAMESSKQVVTDEWDPWAQAEYTNAMLYAIDPIAGTVELVGDTGVKSNMLASMSYDYDTNRLYWTPLYQGSSYTGGLHIVDTETGAATSLGAIGMAGAQVSGLYIISENFPAESEAAVQKLIVTPAKTSITAGATTTVNAYTLPLSLDAEVVWSSSDESVATVDENGVVTGVAQGKAEITATVTYGDVTMSASSSVAVLNADAAFLTYNITDGGWSNISRADGSVTNATEGEETAVSAIASIGSKVYGYDAENNFFSLNTQTNERTVIGAADSAAAVAEFLAYHGYSEEEIAAEAEFYTLQIRDMNYDAANERMLVLGAVVDAEYGDELNEANVLFEANMGDGTLTELHRFTDYYYVMAMTVDADGIVYYYNAYDDYYTALDLSTGITSGVVSLQTQSQYGDYESSHDMYYDELTGLIYHLFTSNGNFYRLFTVDPVSGALNLAFEYVGEVEYDPDSWAYVGDSFVGLTFVEEPEYSVKYTNVSISLTGDIGLNYYAVLSEDLAADDGAYMEFTVGTTKQKVAVSDALVGEDGSYRFSCTVSAKQMADVVTGQMYTSDGTAVGEAKQYSVKAYCDAAIPLYGQYEAYASLVDLLKAMLNYGANAQLALNYNTENLANANLAEADQALPETVDASAYAHSVTGSEDGISVYSASLLLDTKTTIRVYFTLAGEKTIDEYTFLVDGAEAEAVASGSLYYVDVPNVAAKDLDEMHTVSVGGLSVTYGGLSYVNQMLNWTGANEATVNVAKALYVYNQAANAYFDN